MDQNKADQMAKDCFAVLSAIAKKYGCTIEKRRGRYSSFDFTPKFTFNEPVPVGKLTKVKAPNGKVSFADRDRDIKMGWAPRGTEVKLHDGSTATIVRSRKVKYEIEMNGKMYVIRFAGCSAVK